MDNTRTAESSKLNLNHNNVFATPSSNKNQFQICTEKSQLRHIMVSYDSQIFSTRGHVSGAHCRSRAGTGEVTTMWPVCEEASPVSTDQRQ